MSDLITSVFIFVALLIVMGWLFPPQGGWLDYIKSCPLWHDPKDKP